MLGAILLVILPVAGVVFLIACLRLPWIVRRDFARFDAERAERLEREAEDQALKDALKEFLDRNLEQTREPQENMAPCSPLARLSRHERDIAARSQSPIDVTKMPESPLAKLRRREARIARKRN